MHLQKFREIDDIRPLAPFSRFQRRGDFRAVQLDVDPIGRNGYPFDNVQDGAFHLDGRHDEPSLGKRESIAQGRIKGARARRGLHDRISCAVQGAPSHSSLLTIASAIHSISLTDTANMFLRSSKTRGCNRVG
jgi:hypothetical protein